MEDLQDFFVTLNPPISPANLEIIKKIELNIRALKLPTQEIVQELVENGMYRLTALDIVTSAKAYIEEQEKRLSYPLGIFWDVENIRIPSKTSGESASNMLKQALKPLGNLVLCNAYFESSDMSTMTPEKRQKLQQCGWNLMDVPHLSKKEVADKVIIVDILLFILSYSGQPCTICLISDDNDFSYLLARLKSFPQVKTIVISKSSNLTSMNCDVSMRWGIDILKVPLAPNMEEEKKELQVVVPDRPMNNESTSSKKYNSPTIPPIIPTFMQYQTMMHADLSDDELSCSPQEYSEYDRNQLIKVMRRLSFLNGAREHLKSLVGIELLKVNPQAYSDKAARNRVFDQALSAGIINQTGFGGTVTVSLTPNYL